MKKQAKMDAVYKAPAHDAHFAVSLRGAVLVVSMLATGRTRNADGSYTKRNPGKPRARGATLDAVRGAGGALTHWRTGRASNGWVQGVDIRLGGNYREDYVFRFADEAQARTFVEAIEPWRAVRRLPPTPPEVS